MAHALLAPSAADRWLHCPGSVALTKDKEDTDSVYAREGTLAHAMCELKLRKYFGLAKNGEKRPIGPKKFKSELDKLKAEELYQPEMDGYTESYVDYIKDTANSFDSAPAVFVEQHVDLSEYVPEGFGSSDCILIHDKRLYVYDFKYGKGVQVDAEENAQMRLYALGAYLTYRTFWAIEEIHMTILQPRLHHISTAQMSASELLSWAEAVVKPAAQKAFRGDPEYHSGRWCRFCKAAATCRAHANSAIRDVSDFDLMLPPELSLEELGKLLQKIPPLLDYAEKAKEYALKAALSGEAVPGWKLVEGRGSRVWDSQEEAFHDLTAAGIAEEMLYHREPYTLAQLEKQLGKKEFEAAVGSHVVKKPGKPALVPEEDPRPELILKNADEDFKEVPNGQ